MIALDLLLLVMIGVCIAYCWILNRRIHELHNSRVEFARMIKEFDAAVVKADKAIVEMTALGKANTDQAQALQDATKEAERASAELSMISEMGTSVAERLENNIKAARTIERVGPTPSARYAINETMDAVDTVTTKSNEPLNENNVYDLNLEQSSNDELNIQHKNELEAALRRIVTNRNIEPNNLTQSDYYDTLRRVNTRK